MTATPHSGDRDAFRSLLALIHPKFQNLSEDLTSDQNRKKREEIAVHLVQRRRGDIKIHYDLAWNPTRHEQREGRADRFGQPVVRTVTLLGSNNPIDGLVLQVILRKHETIRKQLGVTVPVPEDTEALERAILESQILGKEPEPQQLSLLGYEHMVPSADPAIGGHQASSLDKHCLRLSLSLLCARWVLPPFAHARVLSRLLETSDVGSKVGSLFVAARHRRRSRRCSSPPLPARLACGKP